MPGFTIKKSELLKALDADAASKVREALNKSKLAKEEVLTLVDVKESLDDNLWQVVLQATGSANAVGGSAPAEPEPKAEEPPQAPPPGEDPPVPPKAEDPMASNMEKRLAKVEKDLAHERAELQKARAKVRDQAALQEVSKRWATLPGTQADLAKGLVLLQDAAQVDEESKAAVGALLKCMDDAATALAEGAFKKLSKTKPADTTGGDGSDVRKALTEAEAEINRIAKTYQEADSDLSFRAARMKAAKDNPKLYAEHQKQLRAIND